MYKLLLVDDFFVERENVKDIIKESGIEIEVIAEVSNGMEALEAIEKEIPDFILTDIEMPVMNGLELAEAVREKYPCIKLIFFSFYNKFEYAQKAIGLDAYGYILKPIVPEEMLESLQNIINQRKNEIEKEKEYDELKKMLDESMPLLADKFKRELFSGMYKTTEEIYERLDYYKLDLNKGTYLVMVVELDDFESMVKSKSLEERELLFIQASRIIQRLISRYKGCIWARADEIHWVVLATLEEGGTGMLQETADDMAASLTGELSECGISMSIGMSSIYSDLTMANCAYEEGIHALQFKFNFGKGQIISINDIQKEQSHSNIELNEVQRELKNIVYSGKEARADDYIESLFSGFSANTGRNTVKNLCFCVITCVQMELSGLNSDFEAVFGKEELVWEKLLRFETILDIKQWMKNILAAVINYIVSRNNSQSKKVIENVKAYIEKNYNSGITIKSIADEIFYNPNYLNNVFKQETGETILEYITKVRMEKAKKLLLEPGLRMYEVAEAVGYSHESYFRNVFKQYAGVSPKEYRENSGRG